MKRPKMTDLCVPKDHELWDKELTYTWQSVLDDTKKTSGDEWREDIKELYEAVELENGILVPKEYLAIFKVSEEDKYLDRLGV